MIIVNDMMMIDVAIRRDSATKQQTLRNENEIFRLFQFDNNAKTTYLLSKNKKAKVNLWELDVRCIHETILNDIKMLLENVLLLTSYKSWKLFFRFICLFAVVWVLRVKMNIFIKVWWFVNLISMSLLCKWHLKFENKKKTKEEK